MPVKRYANTNLLFPGSERLPKIFLQPGEVHIAKSPAIVTTVLGSCVSALLYSERLKVSAVCHSVLPYYCKNDRHDPLRYVDSSLKHMVQTMTDMTGVKTPSLRVKLFGGANLIGSEDEENTYKFDVGQQNIQAARDTLAKYGLRVDSSKVGGSRGYKLHFRTDTGEVLVRKVNSSVNFLPSVPYKSKRSF